MNKIMKIFLIIGVSLVIVGGIIAGGSFVAAGFNWDKFVISDEDLTAYSADIQGAEVTDLLVANGYDHYNINIVASDDDQFHISYAALDKDDIKYNVKDGTLTISGKKHQWQDYIGFYYYNDRPLTIAVPQTLVNADIRTGAMDFAWKDLSITGDLNIYNDAGNNNITNASFGNLRILTDAGSTDLKNIQSNTIALESDYGSMDAQGITCDGFTIEADSEDISLEDLVAKTMKIEADYGTLEMKRVTTDTLEAYADSGNIEFSLLNIGQSLKFDADYADIQGTIDGSLSDFTITCEVDYGDSNLPQSSLGGNKAMNISADSGAVNITFMK